MKDKYLSYAGARASNFNFITFSWSFSVVNETLKFMMFAVIQTNQVISTCQLGLNNCVISNTYSLCFPNI